MNRCPDCGDWMDDPLTHSCPEPLTKLTPWARHAKREPFMTPSEWALSLGLSAMLIMIVLAWMFEGR